MNNKRRIVVFAVVGIIALLILLRTTASFFTEYWLFASLNFGDVFWKTVETQYGLWLAGFLLASLFLHVNVRMALKAPKEFQLDPRFDALMEGLGKVVTILAHVVTVVVGLVMAGIIRSNWMEWLTFLNAESFGITDPVFGRDAGFYIFTLPFLSSMSGWVLGLLIVTLIAVTGVYVLRQSVSLSAGRIVVSDHFRRHAAALLSAVLLLFAARAWLDRYDILFSMRSGSLFGAGYTDVYAQLPASWISAVLYLAAAVLVYVFLMRKRMRQVMLLLVGLVVINILAKGVYPAAIQNFIVNPTEQEKELPFIQNNIAFTRNAYQLTNITEQTVMPRFELSRADVITDSATIKNVMLWDYRPLASTLDQLQVIRLYYDFPDVDIDRYTLPNGEYRQVMLGARELNQEKLPANARTWVNERLVYTHGYGVGMSPVNVVTEEGLPEFFIRDIPPVSPTGFTIDRPEIYFGEQTDAAVIVRGGIEEFDYPMGDDNVFTTYKEQAGVSIGSLFRRLLFALEFNDLNMLISGYLTPESHILYTRNIHERVRLLAPFLSFDRDPYMTIDNGRLVWIYDAYTTTNHFPYSKPHEGAFNYIRNSVKVTIDAYSGATTFYVNRRDEDPIIRTYMRIYPTMFRDISEMPRSLFAHVRYPQDLFDVQAAMYAVYHMDDPQVFYNKEDVWNIANEKLGNEPTQMESYWSIMRLPGEAKPEFIQMLPYTPNKRDNMVAWLCARSDGDNYGRLLVFKYPKQDLTYGPMQVSARIDQDPVISQQLTLWNQQGSSVTRGNLLVIPIRNEVVYIQPVYLQATSGKLPELKRVIVSFGNRIAMEPTLDAALAGVFGARPDTTKPAAAAGAAPVEGAKAAEVSVTALSRQALDHYTRAQRHLKEGNWAKYGEEQELLRKTLEQLVKQQAR